MSIDATKKRWQRAHHRTVEVMSCLGPVLHMRPGQPVDYESPALDVYIRLCLDAIPADVRRELEAFKRGVNGKRVYVHLYAPGDDKPKPVEIFAPRAK